MENNYGNAPVCMAMWTLISYIFESSKIVGRQLGWGNSDKGKLAWIFQYHDKKN